MKKILIATALTALMGTTTVFAAGSSTGEIKFTGEVTKASCSMDAVEPINLGSISTRTLAEAGNQSTRQNTTIKFRDCGFEDSEASIISIKVDSAPAAPGKATLFRNQGSAENVGVALYSGGAAITPAGTTLEDIIVGADGGNITVVVQGQMEALSNAVKPGSVEGIVGFTATYK